MDKKDNTWIEYEKDKFLREHREKQMDEWIKFHASYMARFSEGLYKDIVIPTLTQEIEGRQKMGKNVERVWFEDAHGVYETEEDFITAMIKAKMKDGIYDTKSLANLYIESITIRGDVVKQTYLN